MGNRKNTILAMRGRMVACFICFILIIALAIWAFWGTQKNRVKKVDRVPEGFVAVEELEALSGGELRCLFWENQISVLRGDGTNCIFQTEINDKSFIVQYNGEYYINQKGLEKE